MNIKHQTVKRKGLIISTLEDFILSKFYIPSIILMTVLLTILIFKI